MTRDKRFGLLGIFSTDNPVSDRNQLEAEQEEICPSPKCGDGYSTCICEDWCDEDEDWYDDEEDPCKDWRPEIYSDLDPSDPYRDLETAAEAEATRCSVCGRRGIFIEEGKGYCWDHLPKNSLYLLLWGD